MEKVFENEAEHKREMFMEADVLATTELINEKYIHTVFVVGCVGSGKTSFSRALTERTQGVHIEIDSISEGFRKEKGREIENMGELVSFGLENKKKGLRIVDHAEITKIGKDDGRYCGIT